MNVTVTPAPRSSLSVRVELPPEQLEAAIAEAVRHISRRTKIAGFRPGKAPRPVVERAVGSTAILDEAMEHLVQRAYRDALREHEILPLTNADVEIEQAEEGKPVVFTATVQVRPEVGLGDYRNFNFGPEIEPVDDPKVDKVVEELLDQNATLVAVEDRGAKAGDYAVIGYVGTRDGVPFEGGTAERMPLILGEERLIPGFEDHVSGLKPGESTEFDITFPDDYGEAELAGTSAHFAVDLKELREKVLPTADDEFARSMGDFADMAAMRAEIRQRLERNALDRARHTFADRIIDYATANATLELPDVLVDQEVEVMHDEFRMSLARQGIAEEAYLKVVEKTEADLHAEFRPNAEKRVKSSSSCRRSPNPRVSRSPTRTSTPRSSARASATDATGRRSPTSSPSGGAASSGARSAGAASSRSSSTSGSPRTPSTRRSRTSRTTCRAASTRAAPRRTPRSTARTLEP